MINMFKDWAATFGKDPSDMVSHQSGAGTPTLAAELALHDPTALPCMTRSFPFDPPARTKVSKLTLHLPPSLLPSPHAEGLPKL
jgi:hypothetical protein